jgi:hypothetical protein
MNGRLGSQSITDIPMLLLAALITCRRSRCLVLQLGSRNEYIDLNLDAVNQVAVRFLLGRYNGPFRPG